MSQINLSSRFPVILISQNIIFFKSVFITVTTVSDHMSGFCFCFFFFLFFLPCLNKMRVRID